MYPNLGYNLVSADKLAENWIQSLFRRLDVRISLETNGFSIGLGSLDRVCVPTLEGYMDDESSSDADYESDSP